MLHVSLFGKGCIGKMTFARIRHIRKGGWKLCKVSAMYLMKNDMLCPPGLISKIRDRNCVLFVGSGLSRAAGLPDWRGLIKALVDHGVAEGRLMLQEPIEQALSKNEFLGAADLVVAGLGVKQFRAGIDKIIRRPLAITATHEIITRIPFRAIITTNYDTLLEDAFSQRTGTRPKVLLNTNGSGLASALASQEFYIEKAHGDIGDFESIVFCSESYERLAMGNLRYIEHLRTTFRTNAILFVGYGLDDPDFHLLLEKEKPFSVDSTVIHYALMEEGHAQQERMVDLVRQFDLQVIRYTKSNDSHPEVGQFFGAIERTVGEGNEGEFAARSRTLPDGPDAADKTEVAGKDDHLRLEPSQESLSASNFDEWARHSVTDLDDLQAIRLQLIAASFVEGQTPSTIIGPHEINKLYLARLGVDPMSREMKSLFRIMIADEEGYRPMWHWFRNIEAANIEKLILSSASTDADPSVRANGFKLLRDCRIGLSVDAKETIASVVAEDSNTQVKKECLAYLAIVADAEFLRASASALADPDVAVAEAAQECVTSIQARTFPEQCLRNLVKEPQRRVPGVDKLLSTRVESIPTSLVRQALEHSMAEIKALAAGELISRAKFTEPEARKLLNEFDAEPKLLGYRYLIEEGSDLSPEDVHFIPNNFGERIHTRNFIWFEVPPHSPRQELLQQYYQSYTGAELQSMVRWENVHGPDVYRILGLDHFEEYSEMIRADLKSSFQTQSDEYRKQRLAEYSADPVDWPHARPNRFVRSQTEQLAPEELAENSVRDVRGEFIRAGLIGILANGERADVELGRKYLFSTEAAVRLEAVKLVEKWGGPGDLNNLTKIAKTADGLLQERAAQAALTLSNVADPLIAEFLDERNDVLTSIVVDRLLRDQTPGSHYDTVWSYLYNGDTNTRLRVASFFALTQRSTELENTLKSYTAELYYYDVVKYFDVTLHAPPSIKHGLFRSIHSLLLGFVEYDFLIERYVQANADG